MELKEIKNKKIFTDFTVNKCKIELEDGTTKVIRFKVFKNDFGRLVFEIDKRDEEYCVV